MSRQTSGSRFTVRNIDYSLSLNGSSQYASISSNSSLNVGLEDFIVGGWFKQANANSLAILVDKHQGSGYVSSAGNIGWDIIYRGDQATKTVNFRMNDGTNPNTLFTTSGLYNFADGKWHHLVWIISRSGTSAFYFDNVRKVTTGAGSTSLTISSTGDLTVGVRTLKDGGFSKSLFNGLFIYKYGVAGLPSQSEYESLISNIYKKDIYTTNNLVSIWSFNNTPNDLYGSNNLSLSGTPSYSTDTKFKSRTSSTRSISKYTVFDGVDGYIEVPDNDNYSVTNTGEITISAWIRPDTNHYTNTTSSAEGEYVHFLGKGQYSPTEYEWTFRNYNRDSTRPNRFSFYIFNEAAGTGVGSYFEDVIQIGKWIHIVGKIDSQYTYIYKNGVLRDHDDYTATITPTNTTTPLRFGSTEATNNSDQSYFKGAMRDIRIWNRALSDAEILSLYGGTDITSGLIGKWSLDESSGSTATDSVNGNNGVLHGGVTRDNNIPSRTSI